MKEPLKEPAWIPESSLKGKHHGSLIALVRETIKATNSSKARRLCRKCSDFAFAAVCTRQAAQIPQPYLNLNV